MTRLWLAMRIAFEKQWVRPESGFDLREVDTYYTRPMQGPPEMAHPVARCVSAAGDMRNYRGC
jgi:hypothetical protein